jgi:SAM-dependent methyltransferase
MNQITRETTKEQVRETYKHYPDTAKGGFAPFHASRVDPIYWDIPDNVSVLDVGCNSGEFLKRILSGRKNVTVKGVDISEDVVKIAREKGLDVALGDGESLPFPDASFDFVVLMEVLVHVHDPRKMLSEIKRVLKPGGVLLGSCPHKNLEMNIWDDARLHHAYYDTAQAYDLLRETFDKVYLKVLRGGQYAAAMAATALGNQEVEILFRCGGEGTKPWDWQLQLKDTLRVWMGPTQSPGVAYYRMTGFADKMNKLDRTDILFSGFNPADENGPGEWQTACQRAEGNRPINPIVVDQLGNMLKIADVAVWQITPLMSVLAFFECIKAVHKKPFVTEMDDWLFDIPSYNIASHPYKPNSEREQIAYRQLKMSDAVIVSTSFLKEQVEALLPGIPVYRIPNAIDFNLWDGAKAQPIVKKEEGRIRIGYTGCGNHGVDLESVAGPIRALLG